MVMIPDKKLERLLLSQGYKCIIGVDEVGMGSLAGPVVACAVSVNPQVLKSNLPGLAGLRDSKLLSARQRAVLAEELMVTEGVTYAIRWCSAPTIDRLNIYHASHKAMHRAIASLPSARKTIVLVDGNRLIANISHSQKAIVKGDRTIWTIAAASVLAKVFRDAMMMHYAKRYPGYGMEIHKGYGTAYHRSRLSALGPSALHRKSFSLL